MKQIFLAFLCVALTALPARAGILDIQEITTPGGITAWLVEDQTIPVIAMKFAFKGSGSANDPIEKQGLARMLSNTLDEGAGDLDSQAFQQELNDLSISLSFSSSRDHFTGSLKTLSSNRTRAFELLELALNQPRFDAEAVDRMRLANLTRIKSDMTDPQWMAARLMNDSVFKDHPYGMNSGGTLSSLPRITPEDLKAKWVSELTRDRLIVSVAGDINKEQLSLALDRIFSSLPAQGTKSPITDAVLPVTEQTLVYKKDIPQSIIQMSLPGIDIHDRDYFAAEIMNYVFGGGGFGSRLMDVAREQKGLTYGIYSMLSDMDHASTFMISTSSKNASALMILQLTQEEMRKMRETPITPQELRNAQTYLIGSVPLDLTSTDLIAGYMLSFQADGLPKNYLDVREAGLKAVTADDVRRVAQHLLKPDHMTRILVGQPEKIDPKELVTVLPNVD